MRNRSEFQLLLLHSLLFQVPGALAGGFVGAFLLRLGFSLPAAMLAYAGTVALRFVVRLAAIPLVARCGFRVALALGATLAALRFLLLPWAADPAWLVLWILSVAAAETLYWPVYHAAGAVTGQAGARGREMGVRQVLGALVGMVGPLAGGWMMSVLGPRTEFAVAGLLCVVSALPVLFMRPIPAGKVPTLREALGELDPVGCVAFVADGWMSAGLTMAWPMVLFASLGSGYGAFGVSNALASLSGAATGVVCGQAIDRGQRDRMLGAVSAALALGFVLRASAGWSAGAAMLANATGAAVGGAYSSVLMSTIYDRAKHSGAAYRFHLATESGWDIGAMGSCLLAALMMWLGAGAALSILPGALGAGVIYLCVRSRPEPAGTPFGVVAQGG